MGALLNPRHERFARAYREHEGNARKAYIEAGYRTRLPRIPTESSPTDAAASRLLRRVTVKKRIGELAMADMGRHKITVDTLLSDLEEDRQLAIETKSAAAAATCTMSKAKLLGLLVDKKEVSNMDGRNLSTPEQILARVTEELGPDAARILASMIGRTMPANKDDSAESPMN